MEELLLVHDESNNAIITDEGVLVMDSKDQTVKYISLEDAQVLFNIPVKNNPSEDHNQSTNSQAACSTSTVTDERTPWSRSEVLQLISFYEKNQEKFKSTTTRNDKIWQMCTDEIRTHSAEQCKNKFFYPKGKYTKQKDNMSTKATGAAKITFAYFDEMDNIFRTTPNVAPVAIASSSRSAQIPSVTQKSGVTSVESENGDNEKAVNGNVTSTITGRTPNAGDKKLETINKLFQQNQENAERRHRGNMQKKEEAINTVKELLALIKEQQRQ